MHLRRGMPSPFEGQGRMFVAYAWIVVLFVVGPTMASRLDDRGLPGARIVLVLIVLSACFVGYAVPTPPCPRRRRARAVSRAARSMGAPYQSHFAPPSTMHALPFLAMVPADNRSLFEGFECALDGRRVSVFTRSQAPDMYEPTIWRSCAATQVAIDAPMLRIERRGPAIVIDHRLAEHTFESESFNETWRVRASDGRFAEALVDQRMMAWLEGVDRLGRVRDRWRVGRWRSRRTGTSASSSVRWRRSSVTSPVSSSRSTRRPRSRRLLQLTTPPRTSARLVERRESGGTWQTRWT